MESASASGPSDAFQLILSELKALRAENATVSQELKQLREQQGQDIRHVRDQLHSLEQRVDSSLSHIPLEIGSVRRYVETIEQKIRSQDPPALTISDRSESRSTDDLPAERAQLGSSLWSSLDFIDDDVEPKDELSLSRPRANSSNAGAPSADADMSEQALVNLAVSILLQHGSVPVGKMGSLLHKAANNHALPAILKTRYGGLKKFLQVHPEQFVLGENHPYNPHVSLRPSVFSADAASAYNSVRRRSTSEITRERRDGSDPLPLSSRTKDGPSLYTPLFLPSFGAAPSFPL